MGAGACMEGLMGEIGDRGDAQRDDQRSRKQKAALVDGTGGGRRRRGARAGDYLCVPEGVSEQETRVGVRAASSSPRRLSS